MRNMGRELPLAESPVEDSKGTCDGRSQELVFITTEGTEKCSKLEARIGMATAKESLWDKVNQFSEQEARQLLDLLATEEWRLGRFPKAKLTREAIRVRLAGRQGFRVPPEGAGPFRKIEAIQCPGKPASELLISDRR